MYTSPPRSLKCWASRLGTYFPNNRLQDAAMLAAVARGDGKSIEQLYSRYASALRFVVGWVNGKKTAGRVRE